MSEFYSTTSRQLHDLSDTQRFADVARRVIVHDRFTAEDKAFIEKARLDLTRLFGLFTMHGVLYVEV